MSRDWKEQSYLSRMHCRDRHTVPRPPLQQQVPLTPLWKDQQGLHPLEAQRGHPADTPTSECHSAGQGDTCGGSHPLYMECDPHLEGETGLCVTDSLLLPDEQGMARMVVSNPSAYPQVAGSGTTMGEVFAAAVVQHDDPITEGSLTAKCDPMGLRPLVDSFEVRRVDASRDEVRRQKLLDTMARPELLDSSQMQRLFDFLANHHETFSVDQDERGETDLLQMQIETSDASPTKQPARRMPFAVRQEVARQLRKSKFFQR